MLKISDLKKTDAAYKQRAAERHSVIIPVRVNGETHQPNGVPYHVTVKQFKPEDQARQHLGDFENLPHPASEGLRQEAGSFNAADGKTYYNIKLHGVPDAYRQVYEKHRGRGYTYPEFQAHVTVPKETYDAHRAGQPVKIEFGQPVYREGDTEVARFGYAKPESKRLAASEPMAKAPLAYHGSPNEFSEFDTGRAGEQHGQARGHGIYVSGKKEGAAFYANMRTDPTKGGLYHVDRPSDGDMLHWDLPISKQPPKVRQAIMRSKGYAAANQRAKEQPGQFLTGDQATGGETYGGHQYHLKMSPKEVSAYLHSLSIKGIKYKHDDYHNYVIFHPSDAKVLGVKRSPKQKLDTSVATGAKLGKGQPKLSFPGYGIDDQNHNVAVVTTPRQREIQARKIMNLDDKMSQWSQSQKDSGAKQYVRMMAPNKGYGWQVSGERGDAAFALGSKQLKEPDPAKRQRRLNTTVEHEGAHMAADALGHRIGAADAKQALTNLIASSFGKQHQAAIGHHLAKLRYKPENPGYEQELINNTRDVLSSPESRSQFLAHAAELGPRYATPEGQRELVTQMKQGWRKLTTAAKQLKPAAEMKADAPQKLAASEPRMFGRNSIKKAMTPRPIANASKRHPWTPMALRHFGTTNDPREAGYVMPGGQMLDFSGRHYSTDHPSLRGKRNVDHRELPDGVPGGTDGMTAFQKQTGAIRHSPESGGIQVVAMPTRQQLMTLSNHYSKNPDGLSVDIAHPDTGETLRSGTIKTPSFAALSNFFSSHFGPGKAVSTPIAKGAQGDWQKEGYKISHRGSLDGGDLEIRAHAANSEPVGSAQIDWHPHDGIVSGWTSVQPSHQRKGLASAMYAYAEKITAQKIRPVTSIPKESKDGAYGYQSDAGRGLWAQRNRSFGKTEIKKGAQGDWQKEKYSLKHTKSQPGTHAMEAANRSGQVVGHVLAEDLGDGTMQTHIVDVHPDHQRKGLASAMYAALERKTGLRMAPDLEAQSPEGAALWRQKGRQFGKIKKSTGSPMSPKTPAINLNPEHGKIVADAYAKMAHAPRDPHVAAAYGALINETKAQFESMLNQGFRFSKIAPGQANPYKTSKDLHADISQNKHLHFFPTDQGFGSDPKSGANDHPMLQPTEFHHDGKPLLANDLFRIVHDYRGHHLGGQSGFGPKGEHLAYLQHKKEFSPLAQKALATETMGQNSWVNFGPHGEANRKNPEKTIYADQKAGLLPDHIVNGKWHE